MLFPLGFRACVGSGGRIEFASHSDCKAQVHPDRAAWVELEFWSFTHSFFKTFFEHLPRARNRSWCWTYSDGQSIQMSLLLWDILAGETDNK